MASVVLMFYSFCNGNYSAFMSRGKAHRAASLWMASSCWDSLKLHKLCALELDAPVKVSNQDERSYLKIVRLVEHVVGAAVDSATVKIWVVNSSCRRIGKPSRAVGWLYYAMVVCLPLGCLAGVWFSWEWDLITDVGPWGFTGMLFLFYLKRGKADCPVDFHPLVDVMDTDLSFQNKPFWLIFVICIYCTFLFLNVCGW